MIKKKESLFSINTNKNDQAPIYSDSQKWLIAVACLSFFSTCIFFGQADYDLD